MIVLPETLTKSRCSPDQYVIPGHIIYKQRGTIWHPGENTIMGRDHTIHAAIAGYVKYYRDPQRHPKRQYIGIVYNKEDKLPYPVGAPRKRKPGLVAVPRKVHQKVEETMSASGIPTSVTRHDDMDISSAGSPKTSKKLAVSQGTQTPSEPRKITDGNSLIAVLIDEKMRNRKLQRAKKQQEREQEERKLRERMGTRVFRLQKDYSYRETNWEIGRLVGDPGSVPGTEKTFSRGGKFTTRRKARNGYYRMVKEAAMAKVERRTQYRKYVWDKRVRMAAARATRAAEERERQVAARAAAKAAATTDDPKLEA